MAIWALQRKPVLLLLLLMLLLCTTRSTHAGHAGSTRTRHTGSGSRIHSRASAHATAIFIAPLPSQCPRYREASVGQPSEARRSRATRRNIGVGACIVKVALRGAHVSINIRHMHANGMCVQDIQHASTHETRAIHSSSTTCVVVAKT